MEWSELTYIRPLGILIEVVIPTVEYKRDGMVACVSERGFDGVVGCEREEERGLVAVWSGWGTIEDVCEGGRGESGRL